MYIHSWTGLARRLFGNGSGFSGKSAKIPAASARAITTASVMLLSIAPLGASVAQQTSFPSDAADLPRYRVELVLFERNAAPLHPEDPGRPPLPPPQETLLSTADPFGEQLIQAPTGENAAPAEMDPRDESIFYEPANIQDLSGILAKLQKLSGYRVLVQEAWVQPGFPQEKARGVDLETLDRLRGVGGNLRDAPGRGNSATPASGPNPEDPLNIAATLWLGRYLHLEIDAELLQGSDVSRLLERRRMRSGEIHYFDSPRLGAIAIVIPVQDSGPMPDEPASQGSPPTAGAG